MGLREWLIVGGIVLVGLILFDGWRRLSARQNKIRLDIDPGAQISDTEDIGHNPELPNGGARIKPVQQDSVLSSLASVENDPLLENDPLVEQAIAVLQADLDKEAELISGMRAEREFNTVFETVMDDGDFVSKPRAAQIKIKTQLSENSEAQSVVKTKVVPETESVELSESMSEPVSVSPVESDTPIRGDSISLTAEEQPEIESKEVVDAATEEEKPPELEASGSLTADGIELEIESLASSELSVDELSPESGKSVETNSKSSAPLIQEKIVPNINAQESMGALGEVDDLFALSDLDFDRPIHELMDANAESEKVEVSRTTSKRTNKPKQPIEKTRSLFDELLEQVDETKPLDDIESLVAESSSLGIDDPIAEPAEAKERLAMNSRTGRQHRELDFTDSELALVILVVAKKGQRLPGSSLRSIVEACGMEFGQMSLFHRYEDDSERSPIQFSMSDAMQPGSFDLDRLAEYETPAVSFFMSLAEPRDLLHAFDCMLATAETLAKHLDAQLLDGEHSALRAQTKEHYRERIQNYKLKHRVQNRNAR